MIKENLQKAPVHYLITGGAGFVGSFLIQSLLEQGKTVTIVDNLSTGRMENIQPWIGHPRFRFAIDSITNEAVLDRLVSEVDTIIHLAAAVGVRLIVEKPVHTIETNIMGTEKILKTALRYRVKVLIASTSEVYGKSAQVPFSEDQDSLLGPSSKNRWAYAASKLVDEFLGLAYQREYGLPIVIFRLFNTIGPRQRGRYGMVVPRLIRQALEGETLSVYGDGTQRRCFCDVRDVIRAIIGLSEHPEAVGKVFNIGAANEISIKDLAERILKITQSRSKISLVPFADAYGTDFEDMPRRVPDTTRIQKLLGWSPSISLDETLTAVRDHIMNTKSVGESSL